MGMQLLVMVEERSPEAHRSAPLDAPEPARQGPLRRVIAAQCDKIADRMLPLCDIGRPALDRERGGGGEGHSGNRNVRFVR